MLRIQKRSPPPRVYRSDLAYETRLSRHVILSCDIDQCRSGIRDYIVSVPDPRGSESGNETNEIKACGFAM